MIPRAPFAIALVSTLSLASTPLAAQAPAPADSTLARRIGALLDSLSRSDEFSGVVVLARGGVPVFARAVGMADRETKIPNTLSTAFNIGSINKVFTMTAVQQLVAAGKLSPDSTIAAYWPDYPNAEVARRVTIRQLLSHRSGIGGNIFGTPASGRRHDVRTLADYLPLFVHEPLEFEPGTRNKYSNAGYVVLGLLIERVTGERYYDYVRTHIYEPAAMTHTAHWLADSLPASVAIGYTRRTADESGQPAPSAPWRRNTEMLPGRGSSAGGGYSTADDLLHFIAALKERRIPGAPRPGIGVAGGAPGLNATLDGDLPGGLDLVVLANLDPPVAENVAKAIRVMLGAD